MENNIINAEEVALNNEITNEENPLDSQVIVKIRFTKEEKRQCFMSLKKKVIKLLYLIEEEQKGNIQIDHWFYGFIFELSSSNALCDNALTDVLVKIHGLYENNNYKTMTHDQIKRQIMESKGILDYLLKQL